MQTRYLAKQALSRAKTELATSQDERVKCAALELRFAMERGPVCTENLIRVDEVTESPKLAE